MSWRRLPVFRAYDGPRGRVRALLYIGASRQRDVPTGLDVQKKRRSQCKHAHDDNVDAWDLVHLSALVGLCTAFAEKVAIPEGRAEEFFQSGSVTILGTVQRSGELILFLDLIQTLMCRSLWRSSRVRSSSDSFSVGYMRSTI